MKKNYLIVTFLLSLTNLHSQMIGGVDVSNLPDNVSSTSAPMAECDVQFNFQTVGVNPSGLAFDGTYFYNADFNSSIHKYNLNGQLAATLPYPGGSGGGDLDFDGTNLWLMSEQQGILYKLNPQNGGILDAFTISTASDPNFFSCAYDNGYVWVNDYFFVNQLLRINATTGAIEDTFNITSGILSLKIINGDLYGLDNNSDILHQFDKTTGAILSSTPWCITEYPLGFCVADSSMWGLSGATNAGGTQSIKRFESALLSNETFAHLDTEVTILPNPATEVLHINSTQSNIVDVEIFNTLGESVEHQNFESIGNVVVDISNFQKGIYFVSITTKNDSYLKKCIKI